MLRWVAGLAGVALLSAGPLCAGGPSTGPAGEAAVTIVAVGDVQLGRGVGRKIVERGADYPFERVRGLVAGADLAIFNLECALSAEGSAIAKRFSFKADLAAADGLARAGFDVAVLANNHSLDCGRAALPETLEALRSRGVVAVGAGMNAEEAAAPLIITKNGLRVAVLARTFYYPDGVIYREDAPTVAVYDPDGIEEEVRAARKQADIVIVSLHWGVEYAGQPQESQRRMARKLIDAGAALVIGHHPHSPQPVERYGNGLIAYSLGNFVFDPGQPRAAEGLLLTCTVTKHGVTRYRSTRVQIKEMQPRPVG
jgi:poly-gamma-glutamate capsule biosynthesis protein CapA/YwtB (metallophosphatase superfamily)